MTDFAVSLSSARLPIEALAPEALIGSGRPVFLPAGLPAVADVWEPLCRSLGLRLETYTPNGRAGDDAFRAQAVDWLRREPALLVLPTSVPIRSEVFGDCPGRIGAFASVSTGTDHVDLVSLQTSGITFLHTPGMNADSVAQYVLAVLPVLLSPEQLNEADWRMAIIGYGRIGRRLGEYLRMMGVRYDFYDPFVEGSAADVREAVRRADVISFHVPLTKEGPHATYHMADGKYLNAFPDAAAVVNTARGKIFSAEVYELCCARHGCVMDVFPDEPPPPAWLARPRLVSPHIAGYHYSARAGGSVLLARNFCRWLGADPALIPALPEPEYELDALTFPHVEDRLLRARPKNFARRRQFYPHRSDFQYMASHPDTVPPGFPRTNCKYWRSPRHCRRANTGEHIIKIVDSGLA